MRDLTIGNGGLTVAYDAGGRMRELFYPVPGLWNHTLGAPSYLGLAINGVTCWLGSDEIEESIQVDSREAQTTWKLAESQVTITAIDRIDQDHSILRREVLVKASPGQKLTLLLHHDFRLLETEYQDGVRFLPAKNRILHYKRGTSVAIGVGEAVTPSSLKWTLGRRDSEEGQGIRALVERKGLDNNPCAVGAGESVLGLSFTCDLDGVARIRTWMAIWSIDEELEFIETSLESPSAWPTATPRHAKEVRDLDWLVGRSKDIINVFEHSVIAAPDTETLVAAREAYAYIWPRDGAFVAMTWDSMGNHDAALSFFEFCALVLTDEGFLHQRYSPDEEVGSSWHPEPEPGSPLRPIQEDSTALVCLAAARHVLANGEPDSDLVNRLILPAARFLLSYRDSKSELPLPSHDLWEERFGIHTFTVASVIAALKAAAEVTRSQHAEDASQFEEAATRMSDAMKKRLFHHKLGRYARMATVGDNGDLHLDVTPDASLAGLFLFDHEAIHDQEVRSTMAAIEETLWVKSGVGGIARYHDDHYHRRSTNPDLIPGNPWIICTLWLAHWHALQSDPQSRKRATKYTDWVLKYARPTGALPEQVHPLTGENVSVCPLVWSHSTLIDTYLALALAQRS